MSAAVFPVGSFATARPHLRAPFPAEAVRARILEIPDDPHEPCLVGLYVTSETLIELLNLVCGEQWDPPEMETVREERIDEQCWEVKMRAHLTIFGKTRSATGVETGPDRALVESGAEARAFKRAARLFGCGHCLYAVGMIKMTRGNGARQLRTGADGQPYMDKRSEAYARGRYASWLKDTGIKRFGQPLGETSPEPQASCQPAAGEPGAPQADPPVQLPSGEPDTVARPAPQASSERSAARAGKRQPARETARAGGCSERLYAELCHLLGQPPDRPLPGEQQHTLEQWLDALAAMQVTEHAALFAANLAIERSARPQEAQQRFTGWLARHAQTDTDRAGNPRTDESQDRQQARVSYRQTSDLGREQEGNDAARLAPAERAGDAQRSPVDHSSALAELERQPDDRQYPAEVIDAIAVMAGGVAGAASTHWGALPTATLTAIPRLLGCADELGWSAEQLLAEIERAEKESQYRTTAGRFTAFASRLTRAAENHAHEQARAASQREGKPPSPASHRRRR